MSRFYMPLKTCGYNTLPTAMLTTLKENRTFAAFLKIIWPQRSHRAQRKKRFFNQPLSGSRIPFLCSLCSFVPFVVKSYLSLVSTIQPSQPKYVGPGLAVPCMATLSGGWAPVPLLSAQSDSVITGGECCNQQAMRLISALK